MPAPPPQIDWNLVNEVKSIVVGIVLAVASGMLASRQQSTTHRNDVQTQETAREKDLAVKVQQNVDSLMNMLEKQLSELRAEVIEARRKEVEATTQATQIRSLVVRVLQHLTADYPEIRTRGQDLAALEHLGVEIVTAHTEALTSIDRIYSKARKMEEVVTHAPEVTSSGHDGPD